VRPLKTLLIHAPKISSLEFDGVAFFSLELVRVTRMKDFPKLKHLLCVDLDGYSFLRLGDFNHHSQ
jgi:hypothetical protein